MRPDARRERLLKRTFLDFQQMSSFVESPLILDRAEGLYYQDIHGKRYFDAIGGIFVVTLGHGHPRVVDAIQKQMQRMTFAPPLHGIADTALDLIEKLGEVTPGNLKYIKPFSGGSESVEAAMKFVRQYFKQSGHPGKYKFITRYHGYHGGTAAAMSASGTGGRKAKFEPQMPGFLKVFAPNHYRGTFSSWDDCNRFAAQSVEDVIVHEDPDTVAGVIVEPIGNTGGIITPTAEYFEMLRRICDRYNVILIFDEVITGFGKTGCMFAAQTYGVTPDIICSGKGMSNGTIPAGAMIAREDMADAFWGAPEERLEFAHGHTFAGNPLAAAASMAVIDEIVEKQLHKKAAALGEYLAKRLEKLSRFGVVREVRGKGILRGVELVKDTSSMAPWPELGAALKKSALRNGIVMRIDPTWFAVSPSLTATTADIDEMCDLIERSLAEAIEMASAVQVPAARNVASPQ
jgi:adenosylmethionine-8-amino-7-oxononanoate aminotransferase